MRNALAGRKPIHLLVHLGETTALTLLWPEAAAGYARTAMYRIFITDRRHARWHLESVRAEVPDKPATGKSEAAIADRLALIEALRLLAPRQRAAVMLRYIEDLDIARTAEILQCEPSTIRSQTTQALATIKPVMGNYR